MALAFPLVEPGAGADFCSAGECAIAHGDNLRVCMAHKDLAGKIDTLATMFQATIGNATDKHSTFSAARAAQPIAAATTAAIIVCIAIAAIGPTDGRQPPPVAIVPFHVHYPCIREALRGPSRIGGGAESDRR